MLISGSKKWRKVSFWCSNSSKKISIKYGLLQHLLMSVNNLLTKTYNHQQSVENVLKKNEVWTEMSGYQICSRCWYLFSKCVLNLFVLFVVIPASLCVSIETCGFNSPSQCPLSVTGLTARHPEQPVMSMTQSWGGGGLGGRRGEGSDALVTGGERGGEVGGQLVLLHIRFCLFFISGFHKNLTVINRQQVALFLFFV